MFPMTVTITNPAQLNAVMAALGVALLGAATPCAAHDAETVREEAKNTTAKEAKPKAEKKQEAAKPEAASTQPTAEQSAAPEQKAEPSAAKAGEAPAATYDDAANAVTKLARTKGRDAAIAVLSQFGATKLPEVKPEDFAAVIAAATEASA